MTHARRYFQASHVRRLLYLCSLYTIALTDAFTFNAFQFSSRPLVLSRQTQNLASVNQWINDERPALTVLIPAYNEEFRIQSTLKDIESYLSSSSWRDVAQVLVVDDGSSDATHHVVETLAKSSRIPMECVAMHNNQGKGAALSYGIQSIYNKRPISLILTTDADGSADISCLDEAYDSLRDMLNDRHGSTTLYENDQAMIAGYRVYNSLSMSRFMFSLGFRSIVRLICGDLGVRDSQCGFKLMTALTGHELYSHLNLKGWSHDVEVLYRCREMSIPLAESSVKWSDKSGSKLVSSPGGILAVAYKMFLDVCQLRLYYMSGEWCIKQDDSNEW